jgi:hypothetical protein
VRVEGADVPPGCDAAAEAGLLVCELERRGHLVHRWRARFHHLQGLVEELSEEGCELFVIEALAPVDVLRRALDRIGERPCALFGPLALALFEQTPVAFALVDAPRESLGELADRLDAWSQERSQEQRAPERQPSLAELCERLREIPNLFFRIKLDGNADLSRRAVGSSTGPDRSTTEPGGSATGPDGSTTGAAGRIAIDVSSRWRSWSYESELLPFAPPVIWSYRGPSRDPLADFSCVPLMCARGCVHAHSALGAEAPTDLKPLQIGSWSERSFQRVSQIYSRDPLCPFGICPPSATIPFEQVLLQAEHFWNQGVRSFEVQAPDPFATAAQLLEVLEKTDRVPEKVRLRPSTRALRRCEPVLTRLLQAHPQVRFEIGGMEFFLAGRLPGLPHFDTSQWESRWIARVLARLGDRAPNLDAVHHHELRLFDPYSTLEEILDTLQVIEEDAPFLKATLSVDAPLLVASPYAPIGRTIRHDELLALDGPFGLGVRFASEEVPLYRDLVARGLAPLLEAVGRLRLPPPERDRLALEGRFRWFRELARFMVSRRGHDRPATDGWGQVLAAVTAQLGLDRARPR